MTEDWSRMTNPASATSMGAYGGDQSRESPCRNGHDWTHQRGDDWTPERGTPCDCGKKRWGIPLTVAREHVWELYANGTFCRRCGVALGSGGPCR